MMRLADPRLLSPVGVHSVTAVLYLGTKHMSEITINSGGAADVAARVSCAPLMQWRYGVGQRGACICVIKVSDIGHPVWRLLRCGAFRPPHSWRLRG